MQIEVLNRNKTSHLFIITFLLIISFIISLVMAELFVRFVLHYPVLGVQSFVNGLDITSAKNGRIYKPYAKMWSVEGGNIITQKNNLGLTGEDVKVSPQSKYIYLMGTSFIEAAETPALKTASAGLDIALKKLNPDYQVVNIAYRNNDPFAQYFRLKYYLQRFEPTAGIIVLDNIYTDKAWKSRYGNKLSFDLKPGQFTINKSPKSEIIRIIRNSSAFMNLYIHLLTSETPDTEAAKENGQSGKAKAEYEYSWQVYSRVLENLNRLLNGKLIVVNIAKDEELSARMQQICRELHISYSRGDLLTRENQIAGMGHLNLKGNEELGKLLFEAYYKAQSEVNIVE